MRRCACAPLDAFSPTPRARAQKLVVRVYDEDLLEADDLLGELTLMINDFQPGVTTQNIYQLRGPNGRRGPAGKERPFGEVALDITFLPGAEFKKRAELAKMRLSSSNQIQVRFASAPSQTTTTPRRITWGSVQLAPAECPHRVTRRNSMHRRWARFRCRWLGR